MSDFFDDELKTEKPEEEQEETTEKRPKKKSGLLKITIYSVCVLMIASGCFLANRFIPKKKNGNSFSTAAENTISVLTLDTSKIKTVSLENPKGSLKLYSEKDGDSENWYVDGVKKELISTYSTSLIVSAATNISATKEITKLSAEECGLDDPSFKVELQKADDSVVSFAVGKDASVGEGCYLKVYGKDEIYLVDASIKDDLNKEAINLAEADTIPKIEETDSIKSFFENGELYGCDSITVTGKNYPKPLVIVENDDAQISEYVRFKITSPDNHLADNIDPLFALFANGVSASGAYSFHANDLARFGLDSPDITVTMKLKNKTSTVKFSKQDDENYAAWSNEGNLIYKVSYSTIESVINSKATDFYSKLVCFCSIDDLTDFNIKTSDNSYPFKIAANSDKDSEDKYVITGSKGKVDCQSFQNLYQFIISLPCDDFSTVSGASGEKITFEFKLKNGGVDSIEFVKVNETRFQYFENGKAMGQVSSTRLKKILKYAEKLTNGEKISELN
ncbi:MAG: DUF4340 domain-containing protein [Clostridia bacterium]|nr:DUF4340 domain-containing protein [Clostridia bacterium]